MATNRNPKAQNPRADTTSTGQSSYTVIGEGGKERHSGYFSSSNPYFANLTAASNNQDKDALYELALQWEADYANRQMQLEENRAILEEQRQYDSPLAQVQRMREAGINPDLEGTGISSGSGSGSAQLTNPGMADQTGQTKFSNSYDNTALVFQGINTAANFASSLSGGFANILNSVSNMKMLPSQIALNEANADLSSAKADEIEALVGGKKESLRLGNVAQGIQNSTAILQQLAEFSNLIAPDTEDFAPILESLGVDKANITPYSDIIKQMHANPEMRDKYAKANLAARRSEAEDQIYGMELVTQMTDLQARTALAQQQLTFESTDLQNKIAALLNTDEYAEDSANLIQGTVDYNLDSLKLQSKQLANDTTVFLEGLQKKAEVLDSIKKQREDMVAYARKQGRSLTGNERATLDRLQAEYISLSTMYSNEFYKIKSSFLSAAHQRYQNYYRVNDQGNLNTAYSLELYNMHSDVTFNDLITHTKTAGEIANMWTNTAVNAAGVVVDAFGVARGFGFNDVYQSTHNGQQFSAGVNYGRQNPK